jgi:hypothetical protein
MEPQNTGLDMFNSIYSSSASCLVGGFNPSENMKVSWDDYSQYMESHKSDVPNHQPDYINGGFNGKIRYKRTIFHGFFMVSFPACGSHGGIS